MNLGRASLSFPAIQGILDMDEIIEMDPWNQINDFVQHNFMQNILNEFNERVTLDPKLTPTDNKRPEKKRATSSSGMGRKSETDQAKPAEKKQNNPTAGGGSKSKGRKREIARKSESGKEEATESKERRERGNDSNGKEQKRKGIAIATKREKAKDKGANDVKKAKKDAAKVITASEKAEKATDDRTSETNNMVTPKKDKIGDATKNERSTMSVNTCRRSSSKSPFETSTPKREISRIGNSSTVKGNAIVKRDVTSLRKDCSVAYDASMKKYCTEETCTVKDINGNCNEFGAEKSKNNETGVERENEAAGPRKVKKEKKLGSNERSRIAVKEKAATVNRGKRYKKEATIAGEKKLGKFAERLLEKQKRRKERRIRRHERKAERAMEEFSHHVTRIVKKMGYLPDSSSNSSFEDDDCRCSISSSSAQSSYHESSCSCSSSSCSCSCSSRYSEYTLCSSSSASSSSSA